MKKKSKIKQDELKEVTPIYKDVTVSMTLSKSIRIKVYNYKIDNNGNVLSDGINYNSIVSDQYILPNESYRFIPEELIFANDCLRNWCVDDFVVVEE